MKNEGALRMDIFYEIKQYLTPLKVANYYLGEPKRKMNTTVFYYSPLRVKEKTASLAVNDKKGFTDFGTGKNYDVISFISELYHCNLRQACDILIRDFGLNIEANSKENLELLKRQRDEQLKVQQLINNWFENTYEVLTNAFKEYRNLEFMLPTNSKALPLVYKKKQYIESLVDLFYNADTKTKIELYKDRKRFEMYERKGRVF